MPVIHRSYVILILIMVFCLVMVTIALILHQLVLLLRIECTYWIILSLLLATPLILAGMKELRKARENGEKSSWQQNEHILRGMLYVAPMVMAASIFSGNYTYSINWPLLELIRTILIAIFVVPGLFIEMGFTIRIVRQYMNKMNPYADYLESIFREGKSAEE